MGKTVFVTDPAVAAHYHVHPAEFVWINDDLEAAWLLLKHHAYPIDEAPPAAYFVHPDAPLPFVPFPDLDPPDTQRANITASAAMTAPNVFDVIFGGTEDTASATGRIVVLSDDGTVAVNATWTQPPGITPDQAATLLQTELQAFGAILAVQKFGPRLELRGTGGLIASAVAVSLRVPIVAGDPAPPPPPPPPPPPAPSPPEQLSVGAEDQHIKLDIDGDGKTDVHVLVDRPPQNP